MRPGWDGCASRMCTEAECPISFLSSTPVAADHTRIVWSETAANTCNALSMSQALGVDLPYWLS